MVYGKSEAYDLAFYFTFTFNRDILKNDMKHRKLIIALAYFFRYGYLLIAIGLSVLLHFYTHFNAAFYIGIFFFAYGLYLLLGYLFRFIHVYCLYQNAYHLKMTPEDTQWNSLKKSDVYGVPAIFITLSIVIFVCSFFM